MNTTKPNPYSIIYPKHLISILEVSHTTAKKIHKDIKEHYKLPKYVLLKHVNSYFKID
jgi:hypothetical protein